MKRLFLIAAALTAATTTSAREYTVTSPDGKIEVKVSTQPELRWSLSRAGERLLEPSRIGLTLAGEAPLGVAPAVRSVRTEAIDTRSTAEVPTKFRELHDRCNELLIAFRGDWAVRLRVYDNGAAYRFETARRGETVVEDETAEFNFASDNDTYWTRERNPDFISHCEAFFERKRLSELERSVYAYLPVYFATPGGTRMVVTETDLEDYPCMFLFGGEGRRLRAEFPPVVLESRLKEGSDRNEEFLRKADYIAVTEGTRTYPWRVVTVDEDDRALLENYLPYQLASKAVEGDASWVRPGKISWDWWNGLNVYGVDFEAGVNTATYKYFIDFASRYGLEYILLDEGWSVSTLNIREPRRRSIWKEIVRYGNEKGVGVILWTLWNPMKKDLTGILDTYRDWGVKGIKIDFMQRSDQEMVNFYEQIARAAYDRGLLVDFHGSFKPAGLQRKYHNVLSFEGVYGMENDKCSKDITPAHDCVLPFTRMVAGPMDYTPGATVNATAADFSVELEPSDEPGNARAPGGAVRHLRKPAPDALRLAVALPPHARVHGLHRRRAHRLGPDRGAARLGRRIRRRGTPQRRPVVHRRHHRLDGPRHGDRPLVPGRRPLPHAVLRRRRERRQLCAGFPHRGARSDPGGQAERPAGLRRRLGSHSDPRKMTP